MTSSRYNNNDIKKIQDQDVDSYIFLHLTEEKLTNMNESSPVSVEVITATEFEKFRKSTRNQLENLNKRINITSEFNKLFSDVKDAQNDIRELKIVYLSR
ncbi:5395_t:CDS:2 [Funneliformis mosseae]|uniref:5395_t:CDS:1 n=1 Tax=Funneliformis mosseae TaxID=27381 RepID=A0A9N9DBD9_FUNMO|nr:5395_t:CDS:2 [Funneliformis mosseae]